MKRFLIIGSVPHEGIGKTYGGTTVLFQLFIDYCKNNSINFELIQANKNLGLFSSVRNYFYVIIKLLSRISGCDIVMVHVASNGAFYLSPLAFVITRLFNKKFIFRKFAGSFPSLYSSRPYLQRKIFSITVLKSDLLFFETKENINFVKELVLDKEIVKWFPNVRKKPLIKKESNEFNRKFVFISHIKKTKGVEEIIEASKKLPEGYIIDLYGPIMDKDISSMTFQDSKANYKGVLNPNDVIETLSRYDVLLLPTYHPGEGYSGIIIEALSIGIPVIATKWNAIPEIITDGEEGLLIIPKDSVDLVKAILSINQDNYFNYTKKALETFEKFDEKKVHRKIIEMIVK